MKRFTDTNKWDDVWFRSLSGPQKLVFLYVIDRCNNAGFWELDEDSMAFHTKLKPEHISGAWQGLGRGLITVDGWVWVRRFLRHQKNENLNPGNNAHVQIITLLSEQVDRFSSNASFAEFLAPHQPLLRGTGKVEVKDKVKGGAGGKPDLEEAKKYAQEIEMTPDEFEGWWDHFESNGWKISGKTPMKDWKAALRNGKRNAPNFVPRNGKPKHDEVPAAFRAPMNPPPTRPAGL